jgi:phosphotransferase system HPr-like phosphotransfer protein
MQIILKKLFGQFEKIKKLPRNIIGLNQLNLLLANQDFRSSEAKILVSAIQDFLGNYLSGFSGLIIPLKKVYIPGIALGQIFFCRLPLPENKPDPFLMQKIITQRLKELASEKAKLKKLKWEKVQELQLDGKNQEEIKNEPLSKEFEQIKNRYKQTIEFLKKLDNLIFLPNTKLTEWEENEWNYLLTRYQHLSISEDMTLVKKPIIIFLEKLTIQTLTEISKNPEKVKAIIVNKKVSLGLRKLYEHLKLPIVQIDHSLPAEHQGAMLALYALEKQKQLIVNPGKEIRTEVLNYCKLFKQNELLRVTNEAQNIPVTTDNHHIRILANLGSTEIDFPEEIKWMIAENADGAGNIYTEQFIPRYIDDLNNWQKYSILEKNNSRLVGECLYPALKRVSEQLTIGYPKEKFQLHFRAFNIRKNKTAEQKFSALIGVNIQDKDQCYELELLKKDPARLVFPLLEALIITQQKIASEEGPDLAPLVSYSLPNISTGADLDLYEKWFNEAYHNLGLLHTGLIEKGIMFGSHIAKDEFERFAAELYRRKIKYFLIDSSRWAVESFKHVLGGNYEHFLTAAKTKTPIEILSAFLINMDNNLRLIYSKNEQLPPPEMISLINTGAQPREYPLAAIHFARTISVPLSNIKTLTAKIRVTAYQNDEVWHKQNFTVAYLMSDNKLMFNNKLDQDNINKSLEDNLIDYRNMDEKINQRIREQKNISPTNDIQSYENAAIFTSTSIEKLRHELEAKTEIHGASPEELPPNLIQLDENTFQLKLDVIFPSGIHNRPSRVLAEAFIDIGRYAEMKIITVEKFEEMNNFYRKEFGENFEKFDPKEILNWLTLQISCGESITLRIKIIKPRRNTMIKNVLTAIANYFLGGECANLPEY